MKSIVKLFVVVNCDLVSAVKQMNSNSEGWLFEGELETVILKTNTQLEVHWQLSSHQRAVREREWKAIYLVVVHRR